MILVTGGTGTVGRELVKELLAARAKFRVLVRNPDKVPPGVEVVRGDLAQPDTLVKALVNVDTMFLLTHVTPELARVHKGAIDAAKKAGVRRIVRLSVPDGEKRTAVIFARWQSFGLDVVPMGVEMRVPATREGNGPAVPLTPEQLPAVRASMPDLISDQFEVAGAGRMRRPARRQRTLVRRAFDRRASGHPVRHGGLAAGEPPIYIGFGSMPAPPALGGVLVEAVRAAVPQVVMPIFGDQFYRASRVQALGIGTVTGAAARDGLASALRETLDARVVARAQDVASRLPADGATVAAQEVERLTGHR